jgi:phosphopantothenoylcysteine decarboxylase/phosphopantothenate--cysteine ligase
MAEACRAEFPAADLLLMAAAVADFRPRRSAATKLKKDQGVPELELEPTEDVISALAAQRRPNQIVVGFAAEHGEQALAYGQAKLEAKGLDAVVVNDIAEPGIGFDAPENEVTIVTRGAAPRRVGRTTKEQVAAAVLDEAQRLLFTDKEIHDRAVKADPDRATRV